MTDKMPDEKSGETEPEKTRRQEEADVEGHLRSLGPEKTRRQEDQEEGDDGGEGHAR